VIYKQLCILTEKLEARCRSSRLTGWWTQKEQWEKMEGRREGDAQGVADPPKMYMLRKSRILRLKLFLDETSYNLGCQIFIDT
jgi:hypothetical protein